MLSRTARRAIDGRHHPLAKELRGMARSGELLSDGPLLGGLLLLETARMIEDAMGSGIEIVKVFVRRGAQKQGEKRAAGILAALSPEAAVYDVASEVFDGLASTETSHGILALARAPQWEEKDLFRGDAALIVVVAGVQDPGNLGAMIRTAEAFGANGMLLTEGTVSAYNAKAVRATAGSLMRVPMLTGLSVAETIKILSRRGTRLFAGVVGQGTPLSEIRFDGPVAVAIGSEGAGLPEELGRAGEKFTIPISPTVESLNAATAAAVVLYEIARQRRESHRGPEVQR
jgi:RNA methyltransferase, TrmH family